MRWASNASLRLGIDVLADLYANAFPEDFAEHDMVYVKCTESHIPIPGAFVDVPRWR